MTTELQEPTWLDPDPVECARAFFDGNVVEIELAGSTGRHTLTDRTQLHSLCGARYRVISPKPKTYTNLQAAEAYFAGKAIHHRESSGLWWSRFDDDKDASFDNLIPSLRDFRTGWLVRDDDPREKKPRQVDVHEALRVFAARGIVSDALGNKYKLGQWDMAIGEHDCDGKPWTVLEEPPCPTT